MQTKPNILFCCSAQISNVWEKKKYFERNILNSNFLIPNPIKLRLFGHNLEYHRAVTTGCPDRDYNFEFVAKYDFLQAPHMRDILSTNNVLNQAKP